MALKPNLRSRNIEVNTFVGILVVTITASFATLFILHFALDVPLKTFASASAYDLSATQ